MSEIASGRLVIFSTHIVPDVEAVASMIAVIRQGELVAFDSPEGLLARAQGRVFRAVIPSHRLPAVQQSVRLSNLARRADGVHLRYVADDPCLEGSVAAEPTLEDAYLLTTLEAAAPAARS